MPFAQSDPSFIRLGTDWSSTSILGTMAVLGVLTYGLYYFGLLGWLIGQLSRLVRWAIRAGFHAWEQTLSWASWWVLLLVAIGLLALGVLAVADAPAVALLFAGTAIFMGVTTCLAYMFIDIERYDVE